MKALPADEAVSVCWTDAHLSDGKRFFIVSYVPNPVKRHGIPCPQGLSLPDLQGDPFRCRMPLEARPVPMRPCELPAHSHIRGYRAAAARTSVFRLGGRTAL